MGNNSCFVGLDRAWNRVIKWRTLCSAAISRGARKLRWHSLPAATCWAVCFNMEYEASLINRKRNPLSGSLTHSLATGELVSLGTWLINPYLIKVMHQICLYKWARLFNDFLWKKLDLHDQPSNRKSLGRCVRAVWTVDGFPNTIRLSASPRAQVIEFL